MEEQYKELLLLIEQEKEPLNGGSFFGGEMRKRCVEVGKNAKKVRKVGKLVLNAYVRSREVNPKALSFF
jgi:hypothetical protein